MIAQAAAGSGKTGAFAISTVCRIDRDNSNVQILVVVNTRELCNQVHKVYSRIIENTGITIANFADKIETKQIVIGTHGIIAKSIEGRKKALDLKNCKCIVIDEADEFFMDDDKFKILMQLKNCKDV